MAPWKAASAEGLLSLKNSKDSEISENARIRLRESIRNKNLHNKAFHSLHEYRFGKDFTVHDKEVQKNVERGDPN